MMPLAPSRTHPRSDDQEMGIVLKPKYSRQEKSSKCLVHLLSVIVIIGAALLIFSTIFLRPTTPRLRLRSVTARNLRHGGNSSTAFFNVTLGAQMTIKNSNFGEFNFENSTGSVIYKSGVVGKMKINKGEAKARETKMMNFQVDVRCNGLISNTSELSRDLSSGVLNMSSHAELSGKIHFMGFINKKRTAQMSCTMSLNLTSQLIQDLHCT